MRIRVRAKAFVKRGGRYSFFQYVNSKAIRRVMDRMKEIITLRELEYNALRDLAEQARREYDILSLRAERALEELQNAHKQLQEVQEELNHKLFREEIHQTAKNNYHANQRAARYENLPTLFD